MTEFTQPVRGALPASKRLRNSNPPRPHFRTAGPLPKCPLTLRQRTLGEEPRYDPAKGQLLSASMLDYFLLLGEARVDDEVSVSTVSTS
jgi:hypothetical protein